MTWAAALIGVWTIITPWAVAGGVHTTRAITSNCIAGGVAMLLSLAIVLAVVAPAIRRSVHERRSRRTRPEPGPANITRRAGH